MNLSADEIAEVPLGVVTVTLIVPAAWTGLVVLIEVALVTVNEVAGVVPNVTAVAPVKPVPVRVTNVPSVVGRMSVKCW